jgi:hypothetical protein
MRSAFDMVSAWASVLATTNSTALQPARDHVVDRIAASTATPNTVIRGFSSRMSGTFVLLS